MMQQNETCIFFYQHFKLKDFITPIIPEQPKQLIQLQNYLIYTDNYLYKYWNNEYTINILTILSWIPTVRLSMATNPSPITLKNVPPLWKKKHINNLIFFLGGGGELDFTLYTTITFERQIKLILHGI